MIAMYQLTSETIIYSKFGNAIGKQIIRWRNIKSGNQEV